MTFEEAKEKAEIKVNEVGKKIMKIQENEDYWFFNAGLPNEQFFDDGAGSVYISKKDGTLIPMHLWLPEVQELNSKFGENSKTIYDYYDENNNLDLQKINVISDKRLTKIIEKVVGNNDPYWIEPVKKIVTKIIEMENETENSISNLLGGDVQKFTSKQLFDIDKLVSEVCSQFKIKLDRSKYENQIVGLPYNIPFKKVDRRLKCPNCNEPLTFLAPDGTRLHCNKCDKYYLNDNGSVGEETSTPYTRDDVLY